MSIPSFDFSGRIPNSQPFAFCVKPKALGIEGPVMSASSRAVWCPFFCILTARREVIRDLPTPPLPLTIPITFLTELCAPRSTLNEVCAASLSLQLSPHDEQSCVQFSLILFTPLSTINKLKQIKCLNKIYL